MREQDMAQPGTYEFFADLGRHNEETALALGHRLHSIEGDRGVFVSLGLAVDQIPPDVCLTICIPIPEEEFADVIYQVTIGPGNDILRASSSLNSTARIGELAEPARTIDEIISTARQVLEKPKAYIMR